MIEIDIPAMGKYQITNLVLDYNGTIACDGKLMRGVAKRLRKLSSLLQISVLTADTYGYMKNEIAKLPCEIIIISGEKESFEKEKIIIKLGSSNTVAIGNGNNDQKMLKAARLGIGVLQTEGCSTRAIQAADIVVTNIIDGLDLLLNPLRCKATLRF